MDYLFYSVYIRLHKRLRRLHCEPNSTCWVHRDINLTACRTISTKLHSSIRSSKWSL